MSVAASTQSPTQKGSETDGYDWQNHCNVRISLKILECVLHCINCGVSPYAQLRS